MTELEMLKHLLHKSGRQFDEVLNSNGITIIQVHFSDFRQQWEFDFGGNLIEEWTNTIESLWIDKR